MMIIIQLTIVMIITLIMILVIIIISSSSSSSIVIIGVVIIMVNSNSNIDIILQCRGRRGPWVRERGSAPKGRRHSTGGNHLSNTTCLTHAFFKRC